MCVCACVCVCVYVACLTSDDKESIFFKTLKSAKLAPTATTESQPPTHTDTHTQRVGCQATPSPWRQTLPTTGMTTQQQPQQRARHPHTSVSPRRCDLHGDKQKCVDPSPLPNRPWEVPASDVEFAEDPLILWQRDYLDQPLNDI